MAIASLTGYSFAEDSIPSDVNMPAEESETTETLQIEEIQTLPEETEATCETSSAADLKQPLQEQTEETTSIDCQPESVTTETTPLHEDKTLDVLGSGQTTAKRQRVIPKTSASKESIAVMTLIRKGGAAFDYRVAAGQALYKDVRSFKGKNKYCMVNVHTMSGKFVRQIKFPYGNEPGNELQCIFHDGSQYYAGIYYSTSQKNDTKKKPCQKI